MVERQQFLLIGRFLINLFSSFYFCFTRGLHGFKTDYTDILSLLSTVIPYNYIQYITESKKCKVVLLTLWFVDCADLADMITNVFRWSEAQLPPNEECLEEAALPTKEKLCFQIIRV